MVGGFIQHGDCGKMIHINNVIIMIPLFSASPEIPQNKFVQTIDYNSYSVKQPNFKNTMEYNTITTEEMVRDTNEKLLQDIIDNLE